MYVDGSHILGWSDTKEYSLISQYQLPFAKNIMAYVLSRCKNLWCHGVWGQSKQIHSTMVILLLIQSEDNFLSHPQNIK